MNKKLLAGLFGVTLFLGGLLSFTPVVLPSRAVVERSVQISASPETVYLFLSDLRQFSLWSPFQEMDPEQKTQIQGSGMGARLTWQSRRMGEGAMTIDSLEPNRSVRLRMDFYSPMPGTGISIWTTKSVDAGHTEVTWHFEQELSYLQRYFGLMMNRMLGAHFEKGLQNLAQQLQIKGASSTLNAPAPH